MKSSKYIQTNLTPGENDYLNFQNPSNPSGRESITLQRQTSLRKQQCNAKGSEEMLIGDSFDSRQHFSTTDLHRAIQVNHEQEMELLCRNGQFFVDPAHYVRAEYGVNRSCCSTPRADIEGRKALQYSTERRGFIEPLAKQQASVVAFRAGDPPSISGTKFQRNASLRRMQHTPEIINTHLGHNALLYDSYRDSDYRINTTADAFDKDLLEGGDEYGFRCGGTGAFSGGYKAPITRTGDHMRLNRNNSERRKRKQGDGMDASESDYDPQQIFELMGSQQRVPTCHCSCDHVYNPGYMCLQEERVPQAPDVTHGIVRPATPGVGVKIETPGTPPYYRSTTGISNSSSSNSASSKTDLSSRHWWVIVTVLLLAAAAGVGVPIALKIKDGASLEERLEFASRLLQEVPLIDGHNDLPWNIRKFLHNRLKDFKFGEDLRNITPWSNSVWSHTDLPRLRQGHVSAQFWAAYVPCDSQYKDAVQLTLEQIDVIRRLTEMYPPLTLCTSAEEIKSAYKKHQVCSLIGVEGGHSLAGSLGVLRMLYHVGVRYLTLTSTCNTPWADCSYEDEPGKTPEHGGLTEFGKSVVKEMNRLGMIVDLSHVSVGTMRDALAVSKAPVIFSHSSAHELCNSTRNVPDATLRKLALNKGVIMVNFYSHFLTCKDVATVADAVAHINHIRDVAGVDNVGLGAGYDGINFVPRGLEDVSSYPTLFAELIGTGRWSTEDLKKLAGLNFLRVLQDVERVRDEFKKAKVPPYEETIIPKPNPHNCSSDHF